MFQFSTVLTIMISLLSSKLHKEVPLFHMQLHSHIVFEGKLLGTPEVPKMRAPSSHMNGGSH